jgi:hypothetical protein
LRARAAPGQRLPPRPGEDLLVALVDQLGVGDRNLARQRAQQGPFPFHGRRRQPVLDQLVEGGVHPADEEAGHAGHARRIAAARQEPLQARQIRLGDLLVHVLREQQRGVDVDAFADQLLDGGNPLRRRRNLDHQVVAPDRAPQPSRLVERGGCVEREQRRHLQADEPVAPRAPLVHAAQGVGSVLDVADREALVEALRVQPARARRLQHVPVVGAAGDRLLEDRRIRGHAAQAVLVDQAAQLAASDQAAAQIVEPDRLAEDGQRAQRILEGGHLGEAPEVARLTAEAGVDERVDQLVRQLHADHAPAQHEHVHVVVLDTLMRRIGVVAQPGADAGHLVGGHRGADAAAAQQDAAFGVVPLQRGAHRLGEVRVVDRLVAVRPDVQHLALLREQERLGRLLQLEAGVIATDRDAHRPPQSGQVQSLISTRSVPCSCA